MATVDIFEYATRNAVRFDFKGVQTTEELWKLNPAGLNTLYGQLCELEDSGKKKSLINSPRVTKESTELSIKIAIVKHIFETKDAEAKAREKRESLRQERARLTDLLTRKQNEAEEGLSPDEIKAKLAELDQIEE
jgi:hypothetical protein